MAVDLITLRNTIGRALTYDEGDQNFTTLNNKIKIDNRDPIATDDNTQKIQTETIWINSSSKDFYYCTDNTTAAANWDLLGNLLGGGGTSNLTIANENTYNANQDKSTAIGTSVYATNSSLVGRFLEGEFNFLTKTITFTQFATDIDNFEIGDTVRYIYDYSQGNNLFHETTITAKTVDSITLDTMQDIGNFYYASIFEDSNNLNTPTAIIHNIKTDNLTASKNQNLLGSNVIGLSKNIMGIGRNIYIDESSNNTFVYGSRIYSIFSVSNFLIGGNINVNNVEYSYIYNESGGNVYINNVSSSVLICGLNGTISNLYNVYCLGKVNNLQNVSDCTILGLFPNVDDTMSFVVGNGVFGIPSNSFVQYKNGRNEAIAANTNAKTNKTYICNATLTITLPTPTNNDFEIEVFINGAFTVTVTTVSGNINGGASVVLNTASKTFKIFGTSTEYFASVN